MAKLSQREQEVASFYDGELFSFEESRLKEASPVEYHSTIRKLDRHISDRAMIADIGAGVGTYSLHLAKRGCSIHLIDIARGLLSASKELLENHGFRDRILSIQQASAKNLEHIRDTSVDAVLMLGPLYHLQDFQDRKIAIKEAQRILKPGGLLFAAGINRLAYFREFCRDSQYFKKFHPSPSSIFPELLNFIKHGNLSKKIGLSLAGGHLTTIDEFKELFSPEFQTCEISGLESFFAHQQQEFLKKNTDIDLWLELVELTGRTAEGLASSEHIMFIGKKNA